MAFVDYTDIPDELRDLYDGAIQQRDRYILGVVQGQTSMVSDRTRTRLRGQSLFRFLAPYWRALDDTTKAIWQTAGAVSGLSGWQLFISDNAVRLKNSMTWPVSPSDIWQVRAGNISIESPADNILLKQEHPQQYWIATKIPGRPWKKQLTLLVENFSLPLELSIRYKSDLTPTGPTQRARYYADIWTTYQGQDVHHELVIDFDPSTDWTYSTVSIANIRGIIMGYTLYIDIYGYTGTLLYDNIRAIHGEQNWAMDPRCDNISKTFTGAFAVVPPFWVPVSLPSGSSYVSSYPPLV